MKNIIRRILREEVQGLNEQTSEIKAKASVDGSINFFDLQNERVYRYKLNAKVTDSYSINVNVKSLDDTTGELVYINPQSEEEESYTIPVDELNKIKNEVSNKQTIPNIFSFKKLAKTIYINLVFIEEKRLQVVKENNELTNRILDKISNYGIESLSKAERQYLDNKSQDIEDDEVSDIASIDTGYQFNDTVDDYEVRFIYDGTEEWDDDPVEYKHMGEFIIDGEEYYATMYTDEDLNVHSFDLHDGEDYVEFDGDLEDSLLEFFQQVGDKLKLNMI